MLKRIFSVLLSLSVLLTLCSAFVSVEAANQDSPFSVVSAYYYDEFFSAYVNVDPSYDEKAFASKVSVSVGKQDESAKLVKQPKNSTAKVTYMLLIDASTSMVDYRDRISSFASKLLEEENAKTKQITVATFGNDFSVLKEHIKKPSSVAAIIDKIEYTQDITDISGSVNKAIKYLSKNIKKNNEIVNLVILTDGIPDLGDSDKLESDTRKAKEIIENTREVVIHSVGFGEWDEETLDALSAGTGLNLTAYDETESAEAGKQLADFTDNLYLLCLPMSIKSETENFTARFNFEINGQNITVSNIKNIDAAASENKKTTSKSDKTSSESKTKTSSAKSSQTKSKTKSKIKSSHTPDSNTKKGNDYTVFIIIGCALGGAVVLLLIVLLALKAAKKRNLKNDKFFIEMKLEVIRGNCLNTDNMIRLESEIFVGRKQSCGIIFDDNTISAVNSRIFIDNGIVYIENVSNNTNTAVCGMKIHSRNRLRSGDEIRIGNSTFVLRF